MCFSEELHLKSLFSLSIFIIIIVCIMLSLSSLYKYHHQHNYCHCHHYTHIYIDIFIVLVILSLSSLCSYQHRHIHCSHHIVIVINMSSIITMNAHVTNIARTCYFELRRLASIRGFLTSAATATPVSAFALSRIDYCSSLLFGSTHDVTSHLQRIQNYAARVILCLPKSSSITTHLK